KSGIPLAHKESAIMPVSATAGASQRLATLNRLADNATTDPDINKTESARLSSSRNQLDNNGVTPQELQRYITLYNRFDASRNDGVGRANAAKQENLRLARETLQTAEYDYDISDSEFAKLKQKFNALDNGGFTAAEQREFNGLVSRSQQSRNDGINATPDPYIPYPFTPSGRDESINRHRIQVLYQFPFSSGLTGREQEVLSELSGRQSASGGHISPLEQLAWGRLYTVLGNNNESPPSSWGLGYLPFGKSVNNEAS
ncbi:MAG: hypothetical protein ACRCV9_18530, partial [Burkholderiaceae bacterium]